MKGERRYDSAHADAAAFQLMAFGGDGGEGEERGRAITGDVEAFGYHFKAAFKHAFAAFIIKGKMNGRWFSDTSDG